MRSPYPGLDQDLFDVVRQIEVDFDTPPHLLTPATFRALMADLAARAPKIAHPTVDKQDEQIGGIRVRRYVPNTKSSDLTLMYMHGGGWTVGSIESHDAVCADICDTVGMTVVSVDYALSPEARYPVALNECLTVYRHLSEQSGVLVGGDSAGANLATAICLKLKDEGTQQPTAQILIYPCVEPDFTRDSYSRHAKAPFLYTDLMVQFWKNYIGDDLKTDAYSAPITAPDLSGLAPAFILNAGLDPLIDEADDYARKLQASGVPVTHHRADDLIHGFLRFRGLSARAREEFAKLTAYLKALG